MPASDTPSQLTSVSEVEHELSALSDPKTLAVNERHGDDHSVNLTKLRGVAKKVKTNHDLARELWDTENTESRLVALLVCKPKDFSAAQLDAMLRDARVPKVRDWLTNYVLAKSPEREELRLQWVDDDDAHVAAAGWALTALRVRKDAQGLDLDTLLDIIERELAGAAEPLQWEMNNTLAYIGIHHPEHRERAVAIGESLEVLKDYPTPPNCTSPYAPEWIEAMVARQ
ncbi:DNA alkylation repair protein [Demequina sediminicola]|uniref:DNA alkylation repair protein n=1 Tax=Demequina sediminicola TaxID=1095026 RepID=UPI0007842B40|nr:DNA alkylation repair protein [Demequina sediminicola]